MAGAQAPPVLCDARVPLHPEAGQTSSLRKAFTNNAKMTHSYSKKIFPKRFSYVQ